MQITVPHEQAQEIAVLLRQFCTAFDGSTDGTTTTYQLYGLRLGELLVHLGRLTVQRDAAMAACEATATGEEEDPCRYDHHGNCQAHGLQPKGECYMELARAALKLLGEPSL